MADSRIIYTTKSGEQIAIPQGYPISVGNRVLLNHTPDGRLITTGNNKIKEGDKVVVLTTKQGEKVSVSVEPPLPPSSEYGWAYILPYGDSGLGGGHKYMVNAPNGNGAITISGSSVKLPECKEVILTISLNVFTTSSVIYRAEVELNDGKGGILSADQGIDTELNESDPDHITDYQFYSDYYSIPVYPGWAGIALTPPDGSIIPKDSKFKIIIPAGTLATSYQVQDNVNYTDINSILIYYYFPPLKFNGNWSLKVYMKLKDILANPQLYQLVD